jgi:hypothetical protein
VLNRVLTPQVWDAASTEEFELDETGSKLRGAIKFSVSSAAHRPRDIVALDNERRRDRSPVIRQ